MWLWRKIKPIIKDVFKIVGPLLIVGLVFLILAILIEPHGENASGVQKFFGSALSHIAVALIVAALLVAVEKAIFFHELRDELITLLNLSKRMSVSGVTDVVPRDDRHYDGFRGLIKDSRRLSVVVNYGKDWVSNWRSLLSERFDTAGTETDWFLLDPGSPFLSLLAEKQDRELAEGKRTIADAVTEMQKKITETIAHLRECYESTSRRGVMRIYLLPPPLFPTVSIYLGEKGGEPGEVMVTFYTVASHKGAVPLLVFRDNEARPNTYTFFRDDVARLRAKCKPCWVGEPPQTAPAVPPAAPVVATPPPPGPPAGG